MMLGNRQGYIAVISAIIVSTVIMAVALVFSRSNFSGRLDTFSFELKDISEEAGRACLEYARLRLAEDSSYGGNEAVSVGDYTCMVSSTQMFATTTVIYAVANIQNSMTNLQLTVASGTLETVNFREF